MFTYVQDAKKTSTIGRKKKLHKYFKGLRQPSWDNDLENSSSLLFLTSENYHETQRYNFHHFTFKVLLITKLQDTKVIYMRY